MQGGDPVSVDIYTEQIERSDEKRIKDAGIAGGLFEPHQLFQSFILRTGVDNHKFKFYYSIKKLTI